MYYFLCVWVVVHFFSIRCRKTSFFIFLFLYFTLKKEELQDGDSLYPIPPQALPHLTINGD